MNTEESKIETQQEQLDIPVVSGSCIIKNACPECGGDVHDGTGTGWEMCMNPKCMWMA